eukprot:CAMPEP_0171168238 /NCGR_PEP_ID=MMETSP0790-20130122/7608_1 /TAXON_ID=2925 /ORGANISM="Alexandrium catenella, Strain OF101" /LENGTH=208 /DNA_ID=CAMNT_0011633073 /DNA_START=96 /DNA_END=722 /DNA_ORIENTATION=-
MFSFACKPCASGNQQTDTVKVSFPPADASDKENAAPEPTSDQLAKLEEEQRKLEQEGEERRRQQEETERRRREEEARALERQRAEEERRRLLEEQRAKEAEESRRQQEAEARRRAEEARRREELGKVLARDGFAGVNERKKKSGLLSSGFTYPLHAAVRAADAEAVGLLLWAGADRSLKDSAKLTPLMLAQKADKKGSHRQVVEALCA